MRRLATAYVCATTLTIGSAAFAQSARPATSEENTQRPATTTAAGDTGLWFLPTASIVPAKKWSASLYRTNTDDGQGFSDISTFPLTVAVGLANRAEIFGSFTAVTRIDRDVRPLFFPSSATGDAEGTGGGILVNHPGVHDSWIGNKVGDLSLGAKISLLPSSSPAALAIRAAVKLPTGDKDSGASSGKTDFSFDGIVSTDLSKMIELTGTAGVIVRGNPSGYSLTNGLRWGFGAGFPTDSPVRIQAELFGEHYNKHVITGPALIGADNSVSSTSTTLKDPVFLNLGVTAQLPRGFFVGVAGLFNVHMSGRDDAQCANGFVCPSFSAESFDKAGLQVRIGFHPGAANTSGYRRGGGGGAVKGTSGGDRGPGGGRAPGGAGEPGARPGGGNPPAGGAISGNPPAGGGNPPAGGGGNPPAGGGNPPAGGGAVTPPGGRPAGGGLPPVGPGNRPPTVRAICDPCTVEMGRTSTVSADAQDPDGDPLRYAWRAPQGTLANTVNRQTLWTAPMQVGPVPVTVSVDDGRGGTASDTATINVIAASARNLVFEDVHFDFDRFSLREDALKELDGVIAALNATPTLKLEIEGYTCNIGTAQYNLALGERRARAVRDYLISRGINAERLHTVSYGEERPKHDNDREETRMLNRRAALVVRIQ